MDIASDFGICQSVHACFFPLVLFLLQIEPVAAHEKLHATVLRLKVDLCSELNLPRSSLKEKRLTGTRNGAYGRVSDLSIGVIELRSIEDIERLGTELKTPTTTLIEIDVLEK